MKSVYVKEQKRYSRAELIDLLGPDEERAANTIRKLNEVGVLKAVRASAAQKDLSYLLEEDDLLVDIDAANELYYVMTFVGLLVVGGCVLKCYPKYLAESSDIAEKLTQIIKVIEKYSAREQMINVFGEQITGGRYNLIAVMLFLLRDYYEFGVYCNSKEIIESNGLGEISWDKTINETFAVLIDERPHYVDLRTKRRLDNAHDFFRRLHESVLTEFTRELQQADLLGLLDLPALELSDERVDALGDNDYLLYRIEGELGAQFNTRKQLVLKALHAYVSQRVSLSEVNGFAVFGTKNFNLVWENVCSSVIGSHLDTPLSALPLPIQLGGEYNGASTLQSIIEKPIWTGRDESGSFSFSSDKTLIPDLVSLSEVDGRYRLIVMDAKYYNIQLRRHQKLKGYPGIDDVTKQYLYQQALRKFTEFHGVNEIRNCFLMPTDKLEIIDLGCVSLNMLSGLGLEDISIRLLPANEIYDLYLQGRRMDLSRLGL